MPARHVRHDGEGWEAVVVQFEVDDPDYVMSFVRTLAPDEQDVSTGTDKVCVDYYGATAYGCITGWEQLGPGEIRLTITAEAAAELDTDETTEFTVEDVPDLTEVYERVRGMLAATGELFAT